MSESRRLPPRRPAQAKAAPRVWQRMLSGRRLDLLDPSPLDVEISDIAHGLARVARWNGQTRGDFAFSVAQHSLIVEQIVGCERSRSALAHGGTAARRAGICRRRHDLAVQERHRRRLQGCGKAAAGGDPSALRPAGASAGRDRKGDQGRGPVSAYYEATLLAGFESHEAAKFFGEPGGAACEPGEFVPRPAREMEAAFLARFAELDAELTAGSGPSCALSDQPKAEKSPAASNS